MSKTSICVKCGSSQFEMVDDEKNQKFTCKIIIYSMRIMRRRYRYTGLSPAKTNRSHCQESRRTQYLINNKISA